MRTVIPEREDVVVLVEPVIVPRFKVPTVLTVILPFAEALSVPPTVLLLAKITFPVPVDVRFTLPVTATVPPVEISLTAVTVSGPEIVDWPMMILLESAIVSVPTFAVTEPKLFATLASVTAAGPLVLSVVTFPTLSALEP